MPGLTNKIKEELSAMTIFFTIGHILLMLLVTLGLLTITKQPLQITEFNTLLLSTAYFAISSGAILIATLLFGRSTPVISDIVTHILATLSGIYAIGVVALLVI